MADLLTLEATVRVYDSATVVPSNVADFNTSEDVQLQLSLQSRTQDSFSVSASAANVALPALPHAPYDFLMLKTDTAIRVNINSQGFQIIPAGVFISMALLNTCLITNDQVPVGGSAPVAARISYLAGKKA